MTSESSVLESIAQTSETIESIFKGSNNVDLSDVLQELETIDLEGLDTADLSDGVSETIAAAETTFNNVRQINLSDAFSFKGLEALNTQTPNTQTPNLHLNACSCAQCCGAIDAVNNAGVPSANFNAGGSKWNQPNGLGSAVNISYSFANSFNNFNGVNNNAAKDLFEEALEVWSEVAPLNFTEITDPGNGNAVDIRVQGDFIDGPSNTLAFAFFPQGGDITFDTGDNWNASLFLETAVHELGHSLGLGHESGVSAIMNPSIQNRYSGPGTAFLLQDDINGVRSIYGSGTGSVDPLGGSPAPTPTPPPPTPSPSPDVIRGNSGNNRLVGTSGRDTIFGLGGNDELLGRGGNDLLTGNLGNDTVLGEAGNDTLLGGNGRDQLRGGAGNDQMRGRLGDDLLRGDQGRDQLIGNRGRDTLVGGAQSDQLFGNSGNDFLMGVNPNASQPGAGEIDTLRGGSGADIFALGNRRTVFYTDGSGPDYAEVKDFSIAQGDILQLNGRASNYSLGNSNSFSGLPANGTLIINEVGNRELVAVVQGDNFSLNSNAVRFV
ncbi:MAG: matrixin family metalloprotease [Cyanobacteria bacterium P01_A01_bin.17]